MKDIRATRNVKRGLLESKKDKLRKIKSKGKKRGGQPDGKQGRRRGPTRQIQPKSKKVKKIAKVEKAKKRKDEEDMMDHFPTDEYMNFKDQVSNKLLFSDKLHCELSYNR